MNKFTPGPWFVDHKSPFIVRAHDEIEGRHIAHIGPANYTPRFDIDIPNARLIAAAPDLLEALEGMLAVQYDGDPLHQLDCDLCATARAAIASAKGESN